MVELINIIDVLREEGYSKSVAHDVIKDKYFYIHGDKFYFRANQDTNTFQIGIRATFDRWANSVDAEFKYPKTNKDWGRIKEWLDEHDPSKRKNRNPA